MTVELRELIIKTEIKTRPSRESGGLMPNDLKALKQQIIDECLRALKNKGRRDSFNR